MSSMAIFSDDEKKTGCQYQYVLIRNGMTNLREAVNILCVLILYSVAMDTLAC